MNMQNVPFHGPAVLGTVNIFRAVLASQCIPFFRAFVLFSFNKLTARHLISTKTARFSTKMVFPARNRYSRRRITSANVCECYALRFRIFLLHLFLGTFSRVCRCQISQYFSIWESDVKDIIVHMLPFCIKMEGRLQAVLSLLHCYLEQSRCQASSFPLSIQFKFVRPALDFSS